MSRDAHFHRNERKLQILRILLSSGPLTLPQIAVRARIYPIRAGYTRLASMVKWQLLRRNRRSGVFIYSLTSKGRARIDWLEQRRSGQLQSAAPRAL